MKKLILAVFTLTLLTTACEKPKDEITEPETVADPIIEQYGYILNDFNVIRDTIRKGDTFGDILFANGVSQEKIMEVATKFRDSFDVRKIV
ncbi:MAG: M23 family peptidase, partial [Aequorivita vladivostokensis]|nr:M23 family peptidase [Aequorivita vladivostokensis]